MKLLAVIAVMLHCGIVSAASAQNYWVVGSYKDAAKAQDLSQKLAASLGLVVRQQEVLIAGVLHHRLLVREMSIDAAAEGRLNSMDITPWLLTLAADVVSYTEAYTESDAEADTTASEKTVRSIPVKSHEQFLVQVGSFSRIDEAMALERKLASAGFGVNGEAKLFAGKVMHQVWVGPTDDLIDMRNRLQKLDLEPGVVRPAAAHETSYANRAAQPVRQVSAPAKTAEQSQSQTVSDRYPKDFNLARLPEKRQ